MRKAILSSGRGGAMVAIRSAAGAAAAIRAAANAAAMTTLVATGAAAATILAAACAERPAAEGEPDQRIQIEAVSYSYNPANLSARPGTIRFVVANTADEVHGFEIEGQGIEEAIEEIQPGTTDSLTVTLTQPGKYEIYCPVDDHEERGMVGTLTIEPGGGAS